MNKPHYNVVCAVIEKDNKILCCQRDSKGECAYQWEFPGGKVEPNETHEDALRREIREEIDCSVNIKNLITTVEHEYKTFIVTLNVYSCELTEGTPKTIVHNVLSWCDRSELKKLNFVEADYKFLDLL